MRSNDAEPGDIADAMAVIRKALETAEGMQPSDRKTALLRDLAIELPELAQKAQDLRRAEMRRSWEAKEASLSGLGDQYHMSKARAQQLVKEKESRKDN